MSTEEVAHQRHDLVSPVLEREMPAVEEVQLRVGQVAQERPCARGGKDRVVRAPDDQRRRLVLAEEGLEARVKRDVGAIVVEEVELDLDVARPVEQRLVVDPVRRVDTGDVARSSGLSSNRPLVAGRDASARRWQGKYALAGNGRMPTVRQSVFLIWE
jgi:hypothetical protein